MPLASDIEITRKPLISVLQNFTTFLFSSSALPEKAGLQNSLNKTAMVPPFPPIVTRIMKLRFHYYKR